MNAEIAGFQKGLWQAHKAMANTLRKVRHSKAMVQGSFYLMRRKCGKPNCRCARGKLHTTWVLTRSEQGTNRIYTVPTNQQAKVRQWASEYRRYQRARAALVKQQSKLLAIVDRMAEQRLVSWPAEKSDVAKGSLSRRNSRLQ